MDFAKINSRSVYGLTIEVFLRNIITFVIIAILSAFLGLAQALTGPFSFMMLPVSFYLSTVTMIVTHKTIVNGHSVQIDDAFEISSGLKTYFWQYLGMSAIPVIIMLAGTVTIASGQVSNLDMGTAFLVLFGVAMLVYNMSMALFGTSLTATAVGGDGMMMISRARITFFYSLIRLLILPSLVIALIVGGIWFYFSQLGEAGTGLWFTNLMLAIVDNVWLGIFLLAGLHLTILFLTLITGVILTKTFIMAEATLAAQGQPTEWGAQAFGIDINARRVVFR